MKFLKNLVLYNEKDLMLFNLQSFRRKRLSVDALPIISEISRKESCGESYSQEETEFINRLCTEKQVLSKAEQIEFDELAKWSLLRSASMQGEKCNFALVLTYDCNMNCPYCFEKKQKGQHNYITPQDIDLIDIWLRNFMNINGFSQIGQISLTGGEPLLEQNLETISYIVEKWPEAELSIMTNGTFILSAFDKLPMKKITNVQVSLDGTKDVHISRRLPGASKEQGEKVYADIISGIKKLLSNGISVKTSTVVDANTISLIPTLMEFLENEGISNHPQFIAGFTAVTDFEESLHWDQLLCEKKQFISKIRDLRQLGPLYREIAEIMYPHATILLENIVREANGDDKRSIYRCGTMANLVLSFIPDGRILTCYCLDCDDGVVGKYKGDIHINQDRLNRMRCRHIYNIPECAHCDYKYLCGGGCAVPNVFSGKGFLSPSCGIFGDEDIMDSLGQVIL